MLPPELTAIRIVGLALAAAILAFAIWRRSRLRNADVLILILLALALAIASGTELADSLLEAFSFERENDTRIVGVVVFAIGVLLLLVIRALAQGSRITRELSGVLEGLAWEEFRGAGHPERFRDRLAVVIPAYEEQGSIAEVLRQVPAEVCGLETAVLVVDDGSRDRTGEIAREHGAIVARHVINRGGGAALRTGYRLALESGAPIVVTLDADGQHLPAEMDRLVEPIVRGEVELASGSRVLGEAEPGHPARRAGIAVFNRLVSILTRTRVTDCSNGYRAIRASVLPSLVLRQEQFHTSELLIEAIKRGVPAKEVPVTVADRLHGHSKKPAVIRYGLGFGNAIVRAWLEVAEREISDGSGKSRSRPQRVHT